MKKVLQKAALFVQRFFFIFLDISGMLLGVFLTILGIWVSSGRNVNVVTGWIILIVGIIAFLIHSGHFFSWKLTQWIFGQDYFRYKPGTPEEKNNEARPH